MRVSARWRLLKQSVRSGLWAVPTLCVLLAVLLALLLVAVDRRLQSSLAFTFGAGPDGAREVLGAVTTAMITFTGLVFSITVVVLQLTSQQFSPRVLRTFLRDRLTQWSLGGFTATFVYAVMVLRTVNSSDEDAFVPAVATTFSLALLLLSVALFVAYIHHISTAVQASSIIGAIGDETRSAIERRFPRDDADQTQALTPGAGGTVRAVLPARRSGVITGVDEQRLVALAAEAGVLVRSRARLGEFVPEGAPVLEVVGQPHDLDSAALIGCVTQARDRTLDQDVAFGFRQLEDIAERALSPGVNDQTTAVQVLDELHDLLRRLATRPLRTGVLADDRGTIRVVLPREQLGDYLDLALEGIEQYGADAATVQRRIDALLEDLEAAAREQHRPAIAARRAARGPSLRSDG